MELAPITSCMQLDRLVFAFQVVRLVTASPVTVLKLSSCQGASSDTCTCLSQTLNWLTDIAQPGNSNNNAGEAIADRH